MRKIISVVAFLGLLLLVTAFVSKDSKSHTLKNTHSAVLSSPILPDEPFDYTIYFPQAAIETVHGATIDPVAINESITPHGATLGRVLFYDKLLSANNELACASCHKQEYAFADSAQFSIGINGALTTRNSNNLNALAWNSNPLFGIETNPLFWDARESVLEEMVLQPIVHSGELGKDLEVLVSKLSNTEYYPLLFANAYGDPFITPERIGDALAQFVRSISSFNSKFDWVMTGEESFTPQEQLGFSLFEQNCDRACHSQPHFGGTLPMNNGLEAEYTDQGLGGWTGIESNMGEFKAPSLRNVALTSPYMHDGRFETLEEVIDFYSDDVVYHPNNDFEWVDNDPPSFDGFHLTSNEKAALLAFLNTLTDQTLITNEKWSNPFPQVSGTSFLPLEEKVEINPNPVKNTAIITLDNNSSKEYKFRLTSSSGVTLKSFQTTSNSVILSKDELPSGIYFLEIIKGNLKKTEKIIFH